MTRKKLRTGFSTGTAAAGAAKAAVLLAAGGEAAPFMDTPLPRGGRMTVPIEGGAREGENAAWAAVVKDGGDDPDATHGAVVRARVGLTFAQTPDVAVYGGAGVGRVTKPGLPVAVGQPAINPAPREQIRTAVFEGLAEAGRSARAEVVIEVERGELIAQKTLNPRLGIVGGISILGTRGTVLPFSHAAYTATIASALDVARAAGLSTIHFTTGGSSERMVRALCPALSPEQVVQCADHAAFALIQGARRGFDLLGWSCFFGKLVKLAQGHGFTHARVNRIDFSLLARWCAAAGSGLESRIAGGNTAREVLDLLRDEGRHKEATAKVAERAMATLRRFAGPRPGLVLHVFDYNGDVLSARRDSGERSGEPLREPLSGSSGEPSGKRFGRGEAGEEGRCS